MKNKKPVEKRLSIFEIEKQNRLKAIEWLKQQKEKNNETN